MTIAVAPTRLAWSQITSPTLQVSRFERRVSTTNRVFGLFTLVPKKSGANRRRQNASAFLASARRRSRSSRSICSKNAGPGADIAGGGHGRVAKKGGRLVVDSSNVCFVARARGGLGYRRVSPRETRRRCADETREGFKTNVPTVPRRARKKKGETSERRLRARPRRLGDARYHRASVRQRARGVGRGHDHEQVHDVSLARQVVQQERHRVFGVRRVLDGREEDPRRLSRRRRARRGRRRRGKRVGGHSPRFRALAGRVARRLARGGLGGSGGTGHLARLRLRAFASSSQTEDSRVEYHDRATGNRRFFFFDRFSGAFSSLFRFAPITSEARTQSHHLPPKTAMPNPIATFETTEVRRGRTSETARLVRRGCLRVFARLSNHSFGGSVVPLSLVGFVSEISLGRAFSVERASPTDGRLLHDTHTNRARSSRRSTWTSSPSPAATSWICARPNTTTACISTA